MNFIITQEHYINDKRVILNKFNHKEFNYVLYNLICCLEYTADWDENIEVNIIDETSSIQIRPKVIFKNTKGYFYKSKITGITYLNDIEIEEMENFIEKAKKKLNL